MNTRCPHCGKIFEVDEAYRGQKTDCMYCGKIFTAGEANAVKKIPTNMFSAFPRGKLEPAAKEKFKTPLLSIVIEGVGLLCIGGAGFCLLLPLILFIDNFKEIERLVPFIIMFFSFLGAAVVSIGLAQIITCIAKTAYNTDRIIELLKNR